MRCPGAVPKGKRKASMYNEFIKKRFVHHNKSRVR